VTREIEHERRIAVACSVSYFDDVETTIAEHARGAAGEAVSRCPVEHLHANADILGRALA
jgi:hypothetical protein